MTKNGKLQGTLNTECTSFKQRLYMLNIFMSLYSICTILFNITNYKAKKVLL